MLTCENGSPWCTESEWQDPDLYPMLCRKCLIALIADRDRLRAENERLSQKYADADRMHGALCRAGLALGCIIPERWFDVPKFAEEMNEHNERLLAENERIRAALEWYADENTYNDKRYIQASINTDGSLSFSSIEVDKGNRARKALEEIA